MCSLKLNPGLDQPIHKYMKDNEGHLDTKKVPANIEGLLKILLHVILF